MQISTSLRGKEEQGETGEQEGMPGTGDISCLEEIYVLHRIGDKGRREARGGISQGTRDGLGTCIKMAGLWGI